MESFAQLFIKVFTTGILLSSLATFRALFEGRGSLAQMGKQFLTVTVSSFFIAIWLDYFDNPTHSLLNKIPHEETITEKYLGQWEAGDGKFTLQIYDENNALFLKFLNGDISPLSFHANGMYFEAPTAFGSLPLIIHNDTLRYNQSKYVKIKKTLSGRINIQDGAMIPIELHSLN